MKIIQILPHSFSKHEINLDPKFYEDDWHVKVAKRIMKMTDQYEIECWRPEKNFKETYRRKGKDRIKYVIFPSTYYHKFEYSFEMINELNRMIKRKEEILVHFHGIIYPNTYLILSFLRNKVPIIAQSHESSSSLIYQVFKDNPLKKLSYFEYLYQKSFFRYIDQIFCLSNEEEKKFSKLCNTKIQPMGIDFNKFKPINQENALKNVKINKKDYLLYVGRLEKLKGLKYLFEGFSMSKNDKSALVIIGEGPYKNKLDTLARELGITEDITFLGHINNEYMPYYYNLAIATILPSLMESFGIAHIESLACKTPLITTEVGSVGEITKNFEGGFGIIPKKDSNSISNAIRDMEGKIDKSKINLKKGKKYYDWQNIIKNTIRVYDRLFEEYYG